MLPRAQYDRRFASITNRGRLITWSCRVAGKQDPPILKIGIGKAAVVLIKGNKEFVVVTEVEVKMPAARTPPRLSC